MQELMLAGRPTTSLGFGGSRLGSTSPAVSRRLLSAAYEEGIRHFDVAPSYGFGRSESLLHEALGKRVKNVTITTKYGLAPPAHSSWIGPFHRIARRMLGPFPMVKRRLRNPLPPDHPDPPLIAAAASRSIDRSLQQLGVDTIDLLLLHEATPDRLHDPELLGMLEDSRRAGKIREFGVGSRSDRVAACLRECPAFCRIVQFESNVFSTERPELEDVPHILHGSLGGPRVDFASWLLNDSERCTRWSSEVGVDLREPGILDRLIFKASVENHRGHIILFSTRTLANLKSNVLTAGDSSLAVPARALNDLIRSQYLPASIALRSSREELAASMSAPSSKSRE